MAITPVDEQAAGLVSKGGATEVARDPNMQLASKGRLFPFVRDLFVKTQGKRKGKPTGRVLQEKLSSDELGETYRYGAERTDEVSPDEFISGEKGQRMKPGKSARMPTAIEERLIKEPYKETQKRLTEKALKEGKLSQKAHDDFVEAGYNYANLKESKERDSILKAAKAALQAEIKNKKPTNPNLVSLSPEEEITQFMNAQEKAAIMVQKDFFKSDTINLKHIQTTDDVKATIEAVSNLPSVDEAMQSLTQGKKSHAQTTDEALALLSDEMGVTKRFLARRIGETFDAKMLLAGRMLLTKSSEQLHRYASEIRALQDAGQSLPTNLLLSFRRQMALHSGIFAQLKGAQTETARALNSFNIMAKGDFGDAQRLADEMLAQNGGEKEAAKLADAYLKIARTNNPGNKHNFVNNRYASKVNNLWQEAYMNGLLSGIPTQFKNIFGSAAFMAYQLPEEFLAGLIGATERGARRTLNLKNADVTDPGVSVEDPLIRFFGFTQSLHDAFLIGYDAFKTNVPTDYLTRLDLPTQNAVPRPEILKSGNIGKVVDVLGHAMRIPSKLLLGTDEFFKAVSQRGELYVQAQKAKRLALQQGKTVEEAEMDALSVMLDPRSVRQELESTARYNTLTTDLGTFGKLIKKHQQPDRLASPIVRTIIPFVTAPTNAILRTLERFPITAPFTDFSLVPDLLGKNGATARQKTVAKMTMGGAFSAVTYNMALDGRITGGYPKNRKERIKLQEAGWQPYSLVFRGKDFPRDTDGDLLPLFDPRTGRPNGKLTYISYAGIEPVGAFLGIAAQTIELGRRVPDDEARQNVFFNFFAAIGDYVLEQPMLMGIASIVKSFEQDDYSRLIDSPLGNMIPGTIGVPNPQSSNMRNINKILDPRATKFSKPIDLYTIEDVEKMDVDEFTGEPRYYLVGVKKTEGHGLENLKNSLEYYKQIQKAIIPGGDREVAAPRYDVFGEQVYNNARFDQNPIQAMYNQLSPFKIMVGEEPSEIAKEMIRIGMPLRRDKKLFARGKLIQISEKAKSDWSKIAKNDIELKARTIKIRGGGSYTFRDAVEEMTFQRDYLKGTKEDQYRIIQTLENKFYEAALPDLLDMPEHKNLMEAYYGRLELLEEGLME